MFKSLLSRILQFLGYKGELFGDVKISDFTEVSTTAEGTIVPIVDNPGAAGGNKKITVKNLLISMGLVTGAVLAALAVTNFTATNLTATSSATLPSSTTVNGQTVCLGDGTNCIAGNSDDTLADVTNRGAVATTSVTLYGGATVGQTFTATGSAVLPSTTTIDSKNVCLADGTNCIAGAEADTLFSVTNRGSIATSSLTLYGGATVGGTLTSTGTANLQLLTFTNGTGTTLETTNLMKAASLIVTGNSQFQDISSFGTATGTGLHAAVVCLTNDTCRTTWPTSGGSSGSDDWTYYPSGTFGETIAPATSTAVVSSTLAYFNGLTSVKSTSTNATTTWLNTNHLFANSSTSTNGYFTNASTSRMIFGRDGGTSDPVLRGRDADSGIYFSGTSFPTVAITGNGSPLAVFNQSAVLSCLSGTVSCFDFTTGAVQITNSAPKSIYIDNTVGEIDFIFGLNNGVFSFESSDGIDYIVMASTTAQGPLVFFPFGTTSSRLTVTSTVILSGLQATAGGASYVCVDGAGLISSSTSVCVPSADKYKLNQKPLDLGLQTLMQLEPIDFDWNRETSSLSGHSIGIRADSAEKVDERLITRNSDGTLRGFRYDVFTAVLLKAIQEMEQAEENQDARIDQLERENADLNQRLQRLETLINL